MFSSMRSMFSSGSDGGGGGGDDPNRKKLKRGDTGHYAITKEDLKSFNDIKAKSKMLEYLGIPQDKAKKMLKHFEARRKARNRRQDRSDDLDHRYSLAIEAAGFDPKSYNPPRETSEEISKRRRNNNKERRESRQNRLDKITGDLGNILYENMHHPPVSWYQDYLPGTIEQFEEDTARAEAAGNIPPILPNEYLVDQLTQLEQNALIADAVQNGQQQDGVEESKSGLTREQENEIWQQVSDAWR
jgi:hypothetical protein